MSGESNERERWDAYLEGLRKKPGELDDMLPMFEYWVCSGYASEVEWRLAIEVADLKRRLDATEEPGEEERMYAKLDYESGDDAKKLIREINRDLRSHGLLPNRYTGRGHRTRKHRHTGSCTRQVGQSGLLPRSLPIPVRAALSLAVPFLFAALTTWRLKHRNHP